MLTFILFILLLSVLVIVHEGGHFFAARRAGMKVQEFGIGFPPRIFSWTDRQGTRWSINLIPLGGFVKIVGENGEERGLPGSFSSKSFFARLLVLAGGVIMNFVLAAFLLSLGYMFGMPSILEGEDFSGAHIRDRAVVALEILPDSPAHVAGMVTGDEVTAVNGTPYASAEAMRAALTSNADGSPLFLTVRHNEEERQVPIQPAYIEEIGREGVGMALIETGTVSYPWYLAIIEGTVSTFRLTGQILAAFGGLIAGVFSREDVVSSLSGPVGIAAMTGEIAELGWLHLVQFAAVLSVNLAVLNALPFPALDGGRIALLFVERIRRRPLSQAIEQGFHAAGFALLLLLVVIVTYHDIVKLW